MPGKIKILFFIIFLVIGYFVFQTVKSRYFNNSSESGNENVPTFSEQIKNKFSPQENKEEAAEDLSENSQKQEENFNIPEISNEDCFNNCEKFEGDENKSAYCRNFCGIKEDDGVSNNLDCGSQSGISKDYCLKDKAVSESDFSLCEEISDVNLKESCQNRVTEDLLE